MESFVRKELELIRKNLLLYLMEKNCVIRNCRINNIFMEHKKIVKQIKDLLNIVNQEYVSVI